MHKNGFFQRKSIIFGLILMKLGKSVDYKNNNFSDFWPDFTPSMTSYRGQNILKWLFQPKSITFRPISLKLGKTIENVKTQILVTFDLI